MRRAAVALLALSALAGCGPRYASSSASPFSQQKSLQLLIRRTDAVPSPEIKDRYAGRHLDGDYAIKTDKNGNVIEAHPLRSIPELDKATGERIRGPLHLAVEFPH